MKTLRLVTLLLWSLSNPAIAQAPPLSLPAITDDGAEVLGGFPAPPILPGTTSAPLPPATPGIDFETPQDQAAIAKSIAELPKDGPQILPLDEPNAEVANATPPPPTLPASPPKEIVAIKPPALTANSNLDTSNGSAPPLAPPLALPALKPLAPPPISSTGAPPPPPLPLPLASAGNGVSPLAIPAFGGESTNSGYTKSWEVPLEPSYKPKKTRFNYKRVTLPSYVYRTHYGKENQHLPIRQTKESYDVHFLHAIARNDIDATRAFLNSGRSVHMRNAQGDNTLIIALQFGAHDVARLLIERGANPFESGSLGVSGLDYARKLQSHAVLDVIFKHYGA